VGGYWKWDGSEMWIMVELVAKILFGIHWSPTQCYGCNNARPGKQNKTPKCLLSATQARGRQQGGLNGYHQCQGYYMLNVGH
jgi:hypothetical protein